MSDLRDRSPLDTRRRDPRRDRSSDRVRGRAAEPVPSISAQAQPTAPPRSLLSIPRAAPVPMEEGPCPSIRRPRSPEDTADVADGTSLRTSFADSVKKARFAAQDSPSSPSPPPPSQSPERPAAPAGPSKPSPKYPPLIVEHLPDWSTHLRRLKNKLGFTPNAHVFGGKGFRFLPKGELEYRTVQRYLTDLQKTENIAWFSYSLPAEKSIKVAIRGLPAETDVDLIRADLAEQGYTPEYIRPIKTRLGRSGCLFFVELKRTPNVRAIYDVREILSLPSIKIEPWRGKKGPAQCHRCQKFRHSSHNCHRTQACVRCGEDHSARDCPRPREDPATCANCSGPHPANHSTCPVLRREARNNKAGTVAVTIPPRQAIIESDNQSSSLMAPANNPWSKNGPSPKKRGKKKRKGQSAPSPPGPASSAAPQVTVTEPSRRPAPAVGPERPVPAPRRPSTTPRESAPKVSRPTIPAGRGPKVVETPKPAPAPSSPHGSRMMGFEQFMQIMQRLFAAYFNGEDLARTVFTLFPQNADN